MNPDTRSLRTASLIAGLALALIVVLAPFGQLPRRPAAHYARRCGQDCTWTSLNSEALFRWGIASLILDGCSRHDRRRRPAWLCSSL